MHISLSSFAPENLVLRDGYGRPAPHQPVSLIILHIQAESLFLSGTKQSTLCDYHRGTRLISIYQVYAWGFVSTTNHVLNQTSPTLRELPRTLWRCSSWDTFRFQQKKNKLLPNVLSIPYILELCAMQRIATFVSGHSTVSPHFPI